MNKNAKKWVAELRSGNYQQGKNYLLKENKHCCLGVACETAIVNGVQLYRKPAFQFGTDTTSFNDHICGLPTPVTTWLRLTDEAVFWDLNDKQNRTFDQIADYIEDHATELFEPSKFAKLLGYLTQKLRSFFQ